MGWRLTRKDVQTKVCAEADRMVAALERALGAATHLREKLESLFGEPVGCATGGEQQG